jgi:hypothetical protein
MTQTMFLLSIKIISNQNLLLLNKISSLIKTSLLLNSHNNKHTLPLTIIEQLLLKDKKNPLISLKLISNTALPLFNKTLIKEAALPLLKEPPEPLIEITYILLKLMLLETLILAIKYFKIATI